MKRFFLFISLILLISEILVINTGCANMIPPTGGPKDTIPPILLKAEPVDSSKNFDRNTITFVFDEFIDQLQNLQENLLISPTPYIFPVVEAKLRTVTIKLKDTLEPNTTYHFEFGNAIRDLNEGNVLKNFTYLFTTGTAIDSLELTGNVILAENGKTDSTLVVMLHRNGEDSAVVNEKPRYVSKLDSKGNFHFRYLPEGTFYIYALKDESGSRKYFNTENLFAFANEPVEIKTGISPVTLFAFSEKKVQQSQTTAGLGFNKTTTTRADDTRLLLANSLINNQQDLMGAFSFTSELPLKNFDSTKISISTDSVFNPLKNYSWLADSTNKKYSLQITWKENTQYHIMFDKEFAEDTSGRKLNKTDTISFYTKKFTDYGSVKIYFNNLDTLKNNFLQFVQGDRVIQSFPLTTKSFTQKLILPGDYELRLLNDENKNGKWDPGDFFGKHKQPEIAQRIDQKINIKSNWENEFEITLQKN